MSFQSFEELQVWRRGKDLAVFVYQALGNCRDFGMRDQMQRASVSIPSNIAEGYERPPKDFARFHAIAIGSSSELRTQTYIASELKIISQQNADHIIEESKQLNRMMRALAKAQLRKLPPKPNGPEPSTLNPQP